MATVLFTQWYPDVSPYVNGCPLTLQLAKIREAAIRLCRQARVWRSQGVTPLDAVAAQQTYVFGTGVNVGSLVAGTKVVHVYEVRFNDQVLDVATPEEFRALAPTWDSDTGDSTDFTLFNEGELSLYPIPSANAAGAIKVPLVALSPTQAATAVDARVYEDHRMTIAKGARALLHSIPKKPYTDLTLGMELEREFAAAIGAAEARVASARGMARLRTSINIRR